MPAPPTLLCLSTAGKPPREHTIRLIDRFLPDPRQVLQQERARLLAMMGLYFLVLFAVGVLRPIRNALALDGLGATSFYRVYLVSAVVILAVPPYDRLANRVRWHVLIPAVAAFFAGGLVLLRLLYAKGSTVFGLVFYGYYDLFSAALVAQFFMAVQLFFNARNAKSAIPLVIVGGAIGASCGGFLTGLLARTIGAPNLMLVAAAFIGAFAAALPFVWAGTGPVRPPAGRLATPRELSPGSFTRVFSNRHIRLIAGLVLITIVVHTMVDYEFNEVTARYAGNRDAISSFQGWFLGATQWLPILVLLGLGPLLKRWGVGTVALILPVAMLLSTLGLALVFGIGAALVAKACDTTFRYSSERTAREVLYLPIPTDLKLRAKAWIDIAIEGGFAKVVAAVVIFLVIGRVGVGGVPWVIAALCVVWVIGALAVRGQYLATLGEAIRGRFASLEGSFATLTERSTLTFIEEALRGDPMQVAFALDLVEQAGRVDAEPLADEMEMLLSHESSDLRTRVLRLLVRFPGLVAFERIRDRLSDASPAVREAAVGALAAADPRPGERERVLVGLLRSPVATIRHATLTVLARGEVPCDRRLVAEGYVDERVALTTGDRDGVGGSAEAPAREELALALGLLDETSSPPGLLEELMGDPEPRVARAALMSAGASGRIDLLPSMLSALANPALRQEAREAVVAQGPDAMETLESWLMDPGCCEATRRQIPSVMARISSQHSVDALLRALGRPDLGPVVEMASLKALNKLRSRQTGDTRLVFESAPVLTLAGRAVDEARGHAARRARLAGVDGGGPALPLLLQALDEAWEMCREKVFRCLGLVFPPEGVHRAYVTLAYGGERSRANAVEWLNETLTHDVFVRVEPILERPAESGRRAGGSAAEASAALSELSSSANSWIGELAAWSRRSAQPTKTDNGSGKMDRIEKLFLLQKVDLLQGARSSDLALLASIAEEVDVEKGETIILQGETNESLYVVIRGSVELRGMGDQSFLAGESTPFGTWALIDSDPSIVGARAAEASRLLRITRSDFQNLLADHPDLAMGMLQGLARRLRGLVA